MPWNAIEMLEVADQVLAFIESTKVPASFLIDFAERPIGMFSPATVNELGGEDGWQIKTDNAYMNINSDWITNVKLAKDQIIVTVVLPQEIKDGI